MPRQSNPFTYSGPVPPMDFVGREEEIEIIFDQLAEGIRGSVAINGERRMGKTSLLYYISEPQVAREWGLDPAKNCFLFLDCQLISPFTPTFFWRHVLKSLSRQSVEGALSGSIDRLLAQREITSADFVAVLDTLYELGQVLIMMLDEFEWLIRTDPSLEAMTRDFLSGLRALINRRPRVMSLVVTTRDSLDELCRPIRFVGSPFYNNFAFLCLKPFTVVEVERLINSRLEGTDIRFTPAERDYVFRVGGPHPYLVQAAAALIFGAKVRGIKEVTSYEAINRRLEEQALHHFNDFWRWSSKRQQRLLTALAAGGASGQQLLAKFSLDRDELERRGLIVRCDDEYDLFSFLFRQWIIANKFSDYGDQDRLHALSEQLKIHHNNLDRLEVKRAQYGLAVPLHLENEIEYVREEITRLEMEILTWEESE